MANLNGQVDTTATEFESQRSFPEIIKQTAAVHITTLAAVYALASSQRARRRVESYQILGFLLIPTLPIASLLYSCYRSIRARRDRGPKGYFRYYLSAALGTYALNSDQDADKSRPLLDLGPVQVDRRPGNWDAAWVCSMIVTLYCLVQSISTLFLWSQRISFSSLFPRPSDLNMCQICSRKDSPTDHENASFALGGVCASLVNLILLLCNWTWEIKNRPDGDPQTRPRLAVDRLDSQSVDSISVRQPISRHDNLSTATPQTPSPEDLIPFCSTESESRFVLPLSFVCLLMFQYPFCMTTLSHMQTYMYGSTSLAMAGAITWYFVFFLISLGIMLVLNWSNSPNDTSHWYEDLYSFSLFIIWSWRIALFIIIVNDLTDVRKFQYGWKDPLSERLWTF